MSDTTIDTILDKFHKSKPADTPTYNLYHEQAKSALYELMLEIIGEPIDTGTWANDVPATDLHYAHGYNTHWDKTNEKLKELFK